MNTVHSVASQLGLIAGCNERTVPEVCADTIEAFRSAFEGPELSADGGGVDSGGLSDKRLEGVVVRIYDPVLGGAESLSVSFDNAMKAVDLATKAGSVGELPAGEWLNAQLAISEASLKYDVATKLVGKVVQTLDTLLKSQ